MRESNSIYGSSKQPVCSCARSAYSSRRFDALRATLRGNLIALSILVSATFISAKDLIVVLGGELGSRAEIAHVAESFDAVPGYDAIPLFYHSRFGIKQCARNLRKEISTVDFGSYEKVHFFCFILGGITLSEIYNEIKPSNVGRIVVIKGPVEEYLAHVSPSVYPDWAIRLVYGKVVTDVKNRGYYQFGSGEPVGLIIETEPNPLGIKVRDRMVKKFGTDSLIAMSLSPDSIFDHESDYCYFPLHHNDVYKYPERFREETITFFRTGMFSDSADRIIREPLRFYPFVKNLH